ncbi:MAG TPA: orotidine-5'-phosphate decarboxylase [Polyangia bacterium]|nr:orotidine-5'-phosphate decarboxylase [Polyangia bacterium]
MSAERLFVALDQPTLAEALALVAQLEPLVLRYKVGLELFSAVGPMSVRALVERGAEVLLDLKLHDIPETVRRAARVAMTSGAKWLTVHTEGGPAMLRAAVAGAQPAQVLGVTVLTSLDLEDLEAVGTRVGGMEELVVQRARLALDAGCAGVIASPREVGALRAALGKDFLIVTPGVRPASTGSHDDQKRTATPGAAIAAGASAVVVGRPIRDAPEPRAVAAALLEELG